MKFAMSISGTDHELEVTQEQDAYRFQVDGKPIEADVVRIAPDTLSILLKGESYTVRLGAQGGIVVGERHYAAAVIDTRSWRSRQQSAATGSGPQKLTASMPGKVVRVLATLGARICAGQGVVVVEAMKMQNEVRAPRDGTVSSVLVHEGTTVNAGDVVAVID
jgi:biotin carboxyl carrier protein